MSPLSVAWSIVRGDRRGSVSARAPRVLLRLWVGKRVRQSVEILDGDRQRRVSLWSERRRHLLVEVDTHAGAGIRAEREPVVPQRAPSTDRGPPAVVAGDVGADDILQRGFEL